MPDMRDDIGVGVHPNAKEGRGNDNGKNEVDREDLDLMTSRPIHALYARGDHTPYAEARKIGVGLRCNEYTQINTMVQGTHVMSCRQSHLKQSPKFA